MALILNNPIITPAAVKPVEKIDPPSEPRKAVSETLVIKKVVKEEPKKTVKHSDFMLDMTTPDI